MRLPRDEVNDGAESKSFRGVCALLRSVSALTILHRDIITRMAKPSELIQRFRIDDGEKFKINDIDPDDTAGIQDKNRAKQMLAQGIAQLAELQDKLYAANTWALLLIFQAMDAAGKDSTIKHVMSGINPQGCQVFSFKSPSSEELDHDFMWRTNRCLPERGRIGIFNRS